MGRSLFPYVLAVSLLSATCLQGATPAPQPRITLVDRTSAAGAEPNASPGILRKQIPGLPLREAHVFAQRVQLGAPVTEVVEVAFNASTKVTGIAATNDFHVEGGTCRANQVYGPGDTCTVLVAFKAKGPGKRAGLVGFSTAEKASPESVGVQAETYGPALSFIPAQITTIPQSVVNGAPMFYAPGDVVVDLGDNLYITDQYVGRTGGQKNSGRVYQLDSSGSIATLIGGGTTHMTAATPTDHNLNVYLDQPIGFTVDPTFFFWTAEKNAHSIDVSFMGDTYGFAGLGESNMRSCHVNDACSPSDVKLDAPSWLRLASNGDVIFEDIEELGSLSVLGGLHDLVEMFYAQPFGLDGANNLYSLFQTATGTPCQILGYNLDAKTNWIASGNGRCGYAGNSVKALTAQMGQNLGGITFDGAGNMYFVDSDNNVIRRVDSYSGLIRTVAGNNALGAGYTGDGGPATAATLSQATGVAVDSNGVLYTASQNPALALLLGNPPSYVLRQIGPAGQANFGFTIVGKTSTAQTVQLTNTGNDDLIVANQSLSVTSPGDFAIDPMTTTCNWTAPLKSGRSCQLGFLFKPTAPGVRTATVTLADNTASFQNTINLSGLALASPATPAFAFNSPAANAQFLAGAPIPVSLTVANNIAFTQAPPTGTVTVTAVSSDLKTSLSYGPNTLIPTPGTSQSTIPSFNIKGLPVGKFTLQANYSGDSINASGSSSLVPITAIQVTPTVTVTSPIANGSFTYGAFVTGNVTVSNAGTTPAPPSPPTGTVTFALTNLSNNTKTTSAAQTLLPGFSGNSSLQYPLLYNTLAVAKYSITAAYSGDTADAVATSAAVTFSVTQAQPYINWATPAPVTTGTKLSATQLNATGIYNNNPVPGTFVYTPPAGTAMNTVGNIPLNVAFTPTDKANYLSATGTVTLVVNKAVTSVPKTTTTLASALNPARKGQSVVLNAAVANQSGSVTPGGTITLSEGGKNLAAASLAGGKAKLYLTGLSVGTHVLTAAYSGDSKHQASSSLPLQQVVVTVTSTKPLLEPNGSQ